MKKIYFLFFIFTFNLYSQDIRSNHSYKNLGFTQVPTVSIHGWLNVNIAQSKQEKYLKNAVLNNVLDYDTNMQPTTVSDVKNKFIRNRPLLSEEAVVSFKIQGINDFGILYGGNIEFNANSTNPMWKKDISTDKSYIYLETPTGKFEFGSELGASKKMKADAGTFATGLGGAASGKYLNYISLPSIVNTNLTIPSNYQSSLFILIPELPTSHNGYGIGFKNFLYQCDSNGNGKIDGDIEKSCYSELSKDDSLYFKEMENSLKISYYTPEIYGFQFGISWTPDTGNKGVSSKLSTTNDTGDLDDVIQYGISYNNNLYGIGLSLSFTGEKGKSETGYYTYQNVISNPYILYDNRKKEKFNKYRKDLNAYQYGGILSYFGLSFSLNIGKWEKSLYYSNPKYNSDNANSKYVLAGLNYEFNGFNISLIYFNSKFQGNRFLAKSIGIDYKVAEGFLPYIEVTQFKFQQRDSKNGNMYIKDNDGWVALAGILLSF